MTKRRFHNVEAWGGDEPSLKEAQRRHLKWFSNGTTVLDIGCGRGVFLELLQENNIGGVGVDIDPLMIEHCKRKGLEAYCEDPLEHVGKSEGRYGGIICSHVIEHMTPDVVIRLLELCYRALRVPGCLVIATPNPACWPVISHDFWLDTTHVRPYPRRLLETVLSEAGFEVVASGERAVARSRLRRCVMFVRRWILGSIVFQVAEGTEHETTIVALKKAREPSMNSAPQHNRL